MGAQGQWRQIQVSKIEDDWTTVLVFVLGIVRASNRG